ncbi:hypothetical protein, partial [Stenotrophomonas maltophilia]
PRVQPENLIRRAEELTARRSARLQELDAQRHIVPATPKIVGGALVVPIGWFKADPLTATAASFTADPAARARIERLAMEAVAAA